MEREQEHPLGKNVFVNRVMGTILISTDQVGQELDVVHNCTFTDRVISRPIRAYPLLCLNMNVSTDLHICKFGPRSGAYHFKHKSHTVSVKAYPGSVDRMSRLHTIRLPILDRRSLSLVLPANPNI